MAQEPIFDYSPNMQDLFEREGDQEVSSQPGEVKSPKVHSLNTLFFVSMKNPAAS